jgi:hypothetical protein
MRQKRKNPLAIARHFAPALSHFLELFKASARLFSRLMTLIRQYCHGSTKKSKNMQAFATKINGPFPRQKKRKKFFCKRAADSIAKNRRSSENLAVATDFRHRSCAKNTCNLVYVSNIDVTQDLVEDASKRAHDRCHSFQNSQ